MGLEETEGVRGKPFGGRTRTLGPEVCVGLPCKGPISCSCPYRLPFHILSFPYSPPSPIPTFPLPTLLPIPTCSSPHLLCSSPTFSPHHHYSSTPYFPASEHFGPGTEDFHNLLAMHYGQVQVISARAVLYDLLKRCAGEVGMQACSCSA